MSVEEQSNMMVAALARLLRDGETAFHGVASPIPMLAILLAQKLHAPNLTYINITGSVNPNPASFTSSTADPVLLRGTASIFTLADAFDLAARGKLDTAFLSGVQIDKHGNINMSAIGDYAKPKVRLPGGAGSAFLTETAGRILAWRTRHDSKTFVDRVNFITAAGARLDRVVTPLCVFALRDGELKVESIHYYSGPQEVQANTGFDLHVEDVPFTHPPTKQEMDALNEIDPDMIRLVEF